MTNMCAWVPHAQGRDAAGTASWERRLACRQQTSRPCSSGLRACAPQTALPPSHPTPPHPSLPPLQAAQDLLPAPRRGAAAGLCAAARDLAAEGGGPEGGGDLGSQGHIQRAWCRWRHWTKSRWQKSSWMYGQPLRCGLTLRPRLLCSSTSAPPRKVLLKASLKAALGAGGEAARRVRHAARGARQVSC